MSDDLQWYCLKTKPRNERITSQLLRTEVGVEVFCPFIRFERARSSGKLWVTEAMFPGYLFARFPFAEQYRHVQATRGVMKIVSFGGRYAVVPATVIDDLRSEVKDEETIVIPSPIEIGDEVQVVSGPFQGVRAIVNRVMPARERVAILLEVLGTEREVEVSTDLVIPDIPHPMSR